MIRKSVALLALAITLSACGARPGAVGQFTVNGQPVPMTLYHSLVLAERHKAERTGVQPSSTSPAGRQREALIESSVIRELVRDTVVEQLAWANGIGITSAQLQQRLSAAEQAFGGPLAFEQALQQTGLEASDFAVLLRYRMLEAQLPLANAGGSQRIVDEAVARARVLVTIGPCAGSSPYPVCLTAA
jgi:SurA N-terminal domain